MQAKNASYGDHLYSFVRWIMGLSVFGFGGSLVIIGTLFLSPQQIDPLVHWVAKGVAAAAGIKRRVFGLEKLDPKATYIFLTNHVNMFDHFVIYGGLPYCMRGVEKESHFRWPFWGQFLKSLGIIPIPPRGDTKRAIAALAQTKRYFDQGISLTIAPEGTRSEDGNLQRFKRGAFYLAVDLQATIVPLTLVGAYHFNRKGDWHVHPCTVDLYIEDPISTAGLTEKDVSDVTERTHSVIASRLHSSS